MMDYKKNKNFFLNDKSPKEGLVGSFDDSEACSSNRNETIKRPSRCTSSRLDLSRSDLNRLLSYLEGELQARDIIIATLKAERAKQLLYQTKYGRLGLNDPLAGLQRDSETAGSQDDFDEMAVGKMYESQLAQLERLIAVQRRAHQRAKHVLSSAEKRHSRTVRELEQEKLRSQADAAQGDDVCALLEKERERLKHEVEFERNENGRLVANLGKAQKQSRDEKERHKAMLLYLINERRQLLLKMQEQKAKINRPANSKIIDELGEKLRTSNLECASLKEVVRTQEEDLTLIRQSILAKTRHNKAESTSKLPPKSRPSGLSLNSRRPSGSSLSLTNHQPTTPTNQRAAATIASSPKSRFVGHLPQFQQKTSTPRIVGLPPPSPTSQYATNSGRNTKVAFGNSLTKFDPARDFADAQVSVLFE